MKKKLSLLALLALVLGLGALNGPAALATCGDGTERTVDNPETTDVNEDTNDELTAKEGTGPSKTVVYGADTSNGSVPPSGYAGTTGNTGYIEAGGDNGSIVEGSTADGSTLSGSVGQSGVCVNDTEAP